MSSEQMDKVKDRIRKLLALAADDAEVDGEITAAMKLAAAAMEKYQLDMADLEAATEAQQEGLVQGSREFIEYGATVGKKFAKWEGVLTLAIQELVGSVRAWHGRSRVSVGTFGKEEVRSRVVFVGTAEDAHLAAELFGEWRHVIATIAQGKFGGVYGGPGARYCMGFATSLMDKSRVASEDRKRVVTDSTRAIVPYGGGSLAEVIQARRNEVDVWLRGTGIRLRTPSKRRRRGYSFRGESDVDAFESGKQDGRRADFQAARKPKLS